MRRIRLNLLIASLVVILLVTPLPSHAAGAAVLVFQKTWGGLANDQASGVAVDASNNTYVVGSTSSFGPGTPGNNHAIILKYNSTGGLVWQKLWNGTGNDQLQAVAVDRTNGDIVTAGFTSSFGLSVIILKFNPAGTLLWQRTWADSSDQGAEGVAVDTSGNIYVTGWDGSGGVGTKVFVLKLDASGSLTWQRTWGGGRDDEASSIAVDVYGNSYVTGYTTSFGPGVPCNYAYQCANIFLLEVDFSGNLGYQRIWGGVNPDYGQGIALDSSGNAYITGSTNNAGAGGSDVILLKYSGGNLVFQKTWGGSKGDGGRGVAIDSKDRVFVTGSTASFGAGGTNVCLLEFNSTGTLLSQATWGGTRTEIGYSVAVNAAGDAFVAGSVNEAPPFLLYPFGNTTLGTPSITPSTSGAGALGQPTASLGTPAGTLGDAAGTQAYAGQQDFFLFKQTTIPPTPQAPASPLDLTLIAIVGGVVAAVVVGAFGLLTVRRRRRGIATVPKPSSQ